MWIGGGGESMGETATFIGKGFHRRICTGGLVMVERKRNWDAKAV
jgi:hypothetical protein